MILESPAKNTWPQRSGRQKGQLLATVKRSARVPYSTEQMFDLVNDIESYPKFLHWCRGARIDLTQGNTIEATLDIGVLGFHQSFRTRNTLTRPERIGIDLVSGPFRRLRGEWRFAAAPDLGSDIALTLAFEVTLSPFGAVFGKVFEELAAAQMTAFTDRAKTIYGGAT